MNIEVRGHEKQESQEPRQEARELEHALRRSFNHSAFVQLGRHHNDWGKPDERIPRLGLTEQTVPGEHTRDENRRHARERYERIRYVMPRRGYPAAHHNKHDYAEATLALRKAP